ncbi:MAG: lysylphosphatidylglycerol synthase transmembrane domain-containing protein [Pseudobdellovibrio sp.]
MKQFTRPLIAVVLLLGVFKLGFIDLNQLSTSLKNPLITTLGVGLFFFHALIFALRWKILVNLETTYLYKSALKDSFIGNFFNFFIPSGVGGDVVKALSVSERQNISKKVSFSLVTVDRVLGLFCLILFSSSFLLVEYVIDSKSDITRLLQISLLLLGLACLGLLFLYHSKKIIPLLKEKFSFFLINKLISFAEQVQASIEKALQTKFILKFISISFLGQFFSVGFLYITCAILTDSHISVFLFLPLACFAFMASAIPLTPAGIGVGQAAFYFIFSIISTEVATAVTTSISLMQFFMLLLSLPGGYFFALSRKSA